MSANKIQLTKNDESVLFTFTDSKHYLTGNGRIEVPLNSLSLVIDSSDMVTFRKAASNDIFVSAPISDFGMSKAELEEWYAENMVGGTGSVDPEQLAGLIADAEYVSSATTIYFYNLDGDEVCSIDATAFVKDGMVDNVVISGSNLVITWNTSAGKQPISIPLTDIFNPSNYYDKSATDTLLSGKVAVSDYNTYTAATNTALSGKADTSAVTAIADSLSGKQDTLQYYEEYQNEAQITLSDGDDGQVFFDAGVGDNNSIELSVEKTIDDAELQQDVTYEAEVYLDNVEAFLRWNKMTGNDLTDKENGVWLSEEEFKLESKGSGETTALAITPTGVTINDDVVVTESMLEDYATVGELSDKADTSAVTAVSDALSGKADTSAVTAAIDAAKAYYIDFGVLTTQGIHDADWDGMVAAINAHRPIYVGVPGTNGLLYYTAECLYQDGSNIIRMTASDNSAHYFYTFTKNGSEDYSFSYQTRPYTTDAEKAAWNAKADVSAVTAISDSLSGKQDTLVSGTNIKTINNTSLLGSGNIDIQGGGGSSSISSCTQAQYDAAEQGGTLDSDTMYVISDAPAVNIANYYTKTEVDDLLLNVDIDVDTAITAGGTNAVEGGAIYTALQGKADNSDTVKNVQVSSSTYGVGLLINKGGSIDWVAKVARINGQELLSAYNQNPNINLATVEDVNYYSYGSYSATTSAFLNGTFYAIEILNPSLPNSVYNFRMDGNVIYGVKVVNNVLTFTDGSGNVIAKPSFISDDSYYDSTNNNFYIYFVEGRYCNYISNTQSYSLRLATSLTTTPIKDKVSSLETALGGMTLRKLTQAQYDELVTKDPNTLYIITNVVNNA